MKTHWKALFVIVAIAMLLLPLGLRAADPPPVVPDPPPVTRAEFDALKAEVAILKRLAKVPDPMPAVAAAPALAAPPAACPCPGAAAPATTAPAAAAGHSAAYDPYHLVSYQAVMDAVSAGQTVRLFNRVPDTAVGTYRLHYATDFPAVAAGVYDCRLVNGRREMTPVAGAAATPAARTGGGDHTHTCGACGTVFDHSPAGDPARTHRCPSCGAGPWPVVTAFAPTAAAAPLAPAPAYKLTPAAVLYGSDCGPGG